MEIHRSARRHGVSDADIGHAAEHPVVVVELDPDADPPKILVPPDAAGNLLEVIALVLDADDWLAIHAMPLRKTYYTLLGGIGDG